MEKKINLILDLDETLIHTKKVILDNIKKEIQYLILPNFVGEVYFRQYLKEFLYFCYNNFNVSFWTSSNSLYCKEILKLILSEEQYKKTKIILISEESKIIDLKTNIIYKNGDSRSKPLDFLWEDSEMSKYFQKENTILIDNELFIKERNFNNTILIENFENKVKNDNVFCKISEILNKIKNTDNIQDENKFYQKMITSCNLLMKIKNL